jgi:hypothetical protein
LPGRSPGASRGRAPARTRTRRVNRPDRFQLEIHYGFEAKSVRVIATVFFEALNVARTLTDQAIRISEGKEETGLVEDSTGPVCSAAIDQPTLPRVASL